MSSGTRIRSLIAGVLALGLLTAVPLGVHLLRERTRKRDASALDW